MPRICVTKGRTRQLTGSPLHSLKWPLRTACRIRRPRRICPRTAVSSFSFIQLILSQQELLQATPSFETAPTSISRLLNSCSKTIRWGRQFRRLRGMSAPGPVRFVSEYQLAAARGQRITREVFGRTVTVLQHDGRHYAIDSACFHMGGPLGESGDIEELAGKTCIVCPWHGRKIALGTGCQVDTDLNGMACASQDRKQRVYATAKDNAGWIWVDLSSSKEESIPSDKYNASETTSGSAYGYGLSHDQSSQSSMDIDMAAPLTPFAGIDRRALIPSPVKAAVPRQENPQQLPYRAQKSTSMRNANARMAVLKKLKTPAAQATPVAPAIKRPAQRTLPEMYARHAVASSMES